MIRGIDISEWQGAVDAGALAAAGIRHAVVRAADAARRPPIDPLFATNLPALRDAGILVDAYVFARAGNGRDPRQQAYLYDQWARAAGDVDRLWVDAEWGTEGDRAPAYLGWWLLTLVDELEAAYGWRDRLGIYTNAAWWNPHTSGADDLGRLPLWVSGYPRSTPPPAPEGWEAYVGTRTPALPRGWSSWEGWQFSSAGALIPGHDVDCNLWRPDFLEPKADEAQPAAGVPSSPYHPLTMEVRPMYDPAIANAPIVASCPGPQGKGALVLCADGGVLIFGDAPVRPAPPGWLVSPVGQAFWTGRTPATISVDDVTGEWTVTSTAGEGYRFPAAPAS